MFALFVLSFNNWIVDRFHYIFYSNYIVPYTTRSRIPFITHPRIPRFFPTISLIITNVIPNVPHCSSKNSPKFSSFLSFLFVINNNTPPLIPLEIISSEKFHRPILSFISDHHLGYYIVKPFRSSTFNRLKKKKNNRFVSPFTHPFTDKLETPFQSKLSKIENSERVSKTWQTRIRAREEIPRTFGQCEPNITAVSAGDSNRSNQGGEEEG